MTRSPCRYHSNKLHHISDILNTSENQHTLPETNSSQLKWVNLPLFRNPQTFIDHRNQPLNVGKYTIVPWILWDKQNPNIHTVDGRNPKQPPGMYKTL